MRDLNSVEELIPRGLGIEALSLQLVGDLVLVEANTEPGMIGEIHMPTTHVEVYPTSGWVYSIGLRVTEDVKRGDFILIDEEGVDIGRSYYDIFEIIISEDGTPVRVWAEIEVEPVLSEQVNAFRAGGLDSALTVKDQNAGGSSVRFNCSDVLSWQFADMANPCYNLSYLHTVMMYLINEEGNPTLFYLISQEKILATIELP